MIDGKRALVECQPTGVVRQQMPFTRISLTEFVVPLKRNQKSSNVTKVFNDEGIAEKWQESITGKRIAARLRRAELTDLDRFKLMIAQKKKSAAIRQQMNKVKK